MIERRHKVIVVLLIFILMLAPVAFVLWATAVPGRSHAGPLPALTIDEARSAITMRHDVEAIASVPHNARHRKAMLAAAAYIESRLTSLGYAVERQAVPSGDMTLDNLEAMLAPAYENAPTLVVAAHYDSFGDMPGANDNGSGVAVLLDMAQRLADLHEKSALRVRFVAVTNEEPPFFKTESMGSMVHAKALQETGGQVIGMISLETMGSYSDAPGSQHYPFPLSSLYPDTGNFIAFVGMISSRDFVRDVIADFRATTAFPSVGGTAPGFVQGIDWSDHWSYAQMGFPSVMVTDTAPFRYPYYHSPKDTPDRLDYTRLARVSAGLSRVVRACAERGDVD